MKIPTLKKILREDIPDAPNWVTGLIGPVNTFMEYVYQALNKNISNYDNLLCQIKEITYVTPSTYPTMSNVEFLSALKVKATGLTLLQIYEKGTYTPPTSAVYIPWVENNGAIVIYPITGLVASKVYTVRLQLT